VTDGATEVVRGLDTAGQLIGTAVLNIS